jgi:hypothetical protein
MYRKYLSGLENEGGIIVLEDFRTLRIVIIESKNTGTLEHWNK